MPKVNIKKSRPKSKAQLVEEKRQKLLKFNQPEFLEEEGNLEKLFLDEGQEDEEDEMADMEGFGQIGDGKEEKGLFDYNEDSEDDDGPPEEFSSKKTSNNRGHEDTESIELPTNPENDDDLLSGYGYIEEKGEDQDHILSSSEDEGRATKSLTSKRNLTRKKRVSKKKRIREMKMRKVDEGVFELDIGGGTDFKVVALGAVNPSQFLRPRMNFKEELLQISTQKSRLKGGIHQSKMLTHARRWRNS